ncbi:ribonuclease H [Senna tora]|uniref:Ribonuclease H n=1 Tax=Senna tora TaxID=362788 RepID=A0A834T1I0_9FABA|nr:ribonuclease H [Senna tora]
MNEAFLMKQGWRIKTDKNSLCSKVLIGKYSCGCDLRRDISAKNHDSWLWKNIPRVWTPIQQNQRWIKGNGEMGKLWLDIWGGLKTPLVMNLQMFLGEDLLKASVAELCDDDGVWRVDVLRDLLKDDILSKVLSRPAPNRNCGEDHVCWGASGDGNFSVKSAYILLGTIQRKDWVWEKIWHLDVPKRVTCFAWQLAHESLATKKRCGPWNEGHVYCHCLRDWILFNLRSNQRLGNRTNWKQVWIIASWMLWHWRNKDLFDSNFKKPPWPWKCILDFAEDIRNAAENVLSSTSRRTHTEVLLRWSEPWAGWFKVNSDGEVKGKSGKAGFGAIIRDDHGRLVRGVYGASTNCSVLKAGAWGALEGLQLARELGCDRVVLECDSRVLVQSI